MEPLIQTTPCTPVKVSHLPPNNPITRPLTQLSTGYLGVTALFTRSASFDLSDIRCSVGWWPWWWQCWHSMYGGLDDNVCCRGRSWSRSLATTSGVARTGWHCAPDSCSSAAVTGPPRVLFTRVLVMYDSILSMAPLTCRLHLGYCWHSTYARYSIGLVSWMASAGVTSWCL